MGRGKKGRRGLDGKRGSGEAQVLTVRVTQGDGAAILALCEKLGVGRSEWLRSVILEALKRDQRKLKAPKPALLPPLPMLPGFDLEPEPEDWTRDRAHKVLREHVAASADPEVLALRLGVSISSLLRWTRKEKPSAPSIHNRDMIEIILSIPASAWGY